MLVLALIAFVVLLLLFFGVGPLLLLSGSKRARWIALAIYGIPALGFALLWAQSTIQRARDTAAHRELPGTTRVQVEGWIRREGLRRRALSRGDAGWSTWNPPIVVDFPNTVAKGLPGTCGAYYSARIWFDRRDCVKSIVNEPIYLACL